MSSVLLSYMHSSISTCKCCTLKIAAKCLSRDADVGEGVDHSSRRRRVSSIFVGKKWMQNAKNALSLSILYRFSLPCPRRSKDQPQSSSSPLSSSSSSFFLYSFRFLSSFLLFSSFSHSLLAASLSRSGKTRSNTSEYQDTGRPSMPSLMFYSHVSTNARREAKYVPRVVPANPTCCLLGR